MGSCAGEDAHSNWQAGTSSSVSPEQNRDFRFPSLGWQLHTKSFLDRCEHFSSSFYGCDVHSHQLVPRLLSSPCGFCLCTRLGREGDLQRAEILSASWQETLVAVTHSVWVGHCSQHCCPGPAPPLCICPLPIPVCPCFKWMPGVQSSWDVTFQRPGSLLGSSALQALVL